MNSFLANTHQQDLVEHLFAVGYVAQALYNKLFGKSYHRHCVFASGCLHDLGKVDPQFQRWAAQKQPTASDTSNGQHIDKLDRKTNFSFNKHPRHNELSLLLIQILHEQNHPLTKGDRLSHVKHAVYWHHAKPIRDKDSTFEHISDIENLFLSSCDKNDVKQLAQDAIQVFSHVEQLAAQYSKDDIFEPKAMLKSEVDLDGLADRSEIKLPAYKDYTKKRFTISDYEKEISKNATHDVTRACVIAADHLISSLSSESLSQHIADRTLATLVEQALAVQSNLSSDIQTCLDRFNQDAANHERNVAQSEAAQKLLDARYLPVLAGAAGSGKTKIALEWAKLQNSQKIIWVCPRVQVCIGMIKELTSEQYLPNTRIELITGEYKETYQNGVMTETEEHQYFSGDIVVTTIDQVMSSVLTHKKINALIEFLNADVVFDEYHEYVHITGLNLIFAELVKAKQKQYESGLDNRKHRMLLVSATPHYYFLEHVLAASGCFDSDDVVEMQSFNQSRYQLEWVSYNNKSRDFDQANPFYQPIKDIRTFVITNTATDAQKSFLYRQSEENAILYHSKFIKSDKKQMADLVFETFKRDGTGQFEVLRSGPIVQASLNISCDAMMTELTHAENTLQRMGRLDRFGKNTEINLLKIVVDQYFDTGRDEKSCRNAQQLKNEHALQATKAWYAYLKKHLKDQPFQLPELYQLYKTFYQSPEVQALLQKELLEGLASSAQSVLSKVRDPIELSSKLKKDGGVRLSDASLRGDSRFVQMAKCDLSNPRQPQWLNEYAYSMDSELDDLDNLTIELDVLQGYGSSRDSLIDYMQRKHHNVIAGVKKADTYNDAVIIGRARDPRYPIYTSYTPNDLAKIGGHDQQHGKAIVYVVCSKQPVGAISTNHLKQIED